MKVRIGNDLCFLVTLKSVVYDINVQSVKAFIINKTLKEKIEKEITRKTKFISRFPIEPMTNSYIATHYNINGCGFPSYNCLPCECKHPAKHWCTPYAGFGVYPPFDLIYPMDPPCNYVRYAAQVTFTQQRNQVKVYFPAEAQFSTGDYSIIIVAQVYHPGYPDNLKTITLDYANAFTLVDSTEEEDRTDGETISILDESATSEGPSVGTDIYVNNGEHMGVGDDRIQLNLTDGSEVFVDTALATGWYVED